MNPFLDLLLRAHPQAEPALRPWYDFAQEVALAPKKVTEPTIGHIRLQWWSDAADEALDAAAKPRAHPAVTAWSASLDALDTRPAPGLVHAMIDAHALDLEKQPYADLEALRADATARWGNMLRVGLQLLQIRDDSYHHAANHLGAAFGLAVSLYNVGPEAAQGRQAHPDFDMPLDRLEPAQRAEAGRRTLGQAQYHIDRAKELVPKPDPRALPVLRLGLAASALIAAADRVGSDPVTLPAMSFVAQTFALRMAWAKLRGAYA
jgi:NADH dehydrogenase [ubiquinone] 1 alpha subcomplex assembly factor 6